MNKDRLVQFLDEILPDIKVMDDLHKELLEINLAQTVTHNNSVSIPLDVSVTVITKAFYKEYFDEIGFDTFRVMVALGKVEEKKSGSIVAEYGLSTLYYDDYAVLITTDFHTNVR